MHQLGGLGGRSLQQYAVVQVFASQLNLNCSSYDKNNISRCILSTAELVIRKYVLYILLLGTADEGYFKTKLAAASFQTCTLKNYCRWPFVKYFTTALRPAVAHVLKHVTNF